MYGPINIRYRNIILTVVLCGCEIWCLTLREENRLRIFENRVLRKVFRPKRDEVTGEWWRPHNEDLCEMYFLPNSIRVTKSRRMKRTGAIALMGNRRGVYRVLARKPGGKRSLGRPRRWSGIILKWIFKKWDRGNRVDWSDAGSGQSAVWCECGNEPLISTKYGKFLA